MMNYCLKIMGALLVLGMAGCATTETNEQVAKDEGFVPLFNGIDFNDWDMIVRSGDEALARKVFCIDENGVLHFYRDVEDGYATKKPNLNAAHGILSTKRTDYSKYILRFEYKWGAKKVNNFTTYQYDAGVFYHCTKIKVFPNGLQYQIRFDHLKNRNHTGDLLGSQSASIQWFSKDGKTFDFPSNGGTAQPKRKGMRFAKADAPFYGLGDQWNQCEIIVMADQYVIHKLNGAVINVATDLPVAAGPIALEAETAELFLRNIEIKELDALVPMEQFLPHPF